MLVSGGAEAALVGAQLGPVGQHGAGGRTTSRHIAVEAAAETDTLNGAADSEDDVDTGGR